MRKQAELYLTDLYYHPNSSYYDQQDRIKGYNRRLLPILREEGLVFHSGGIDVGSSNPIALWSLTIAGHTLVEKLLKNKEVPVSYWSRLKRMLNR